jgi:hypothetical protein
MKIISSDLFWCFLYFYIVILRLLLVMNFTISVSWITDGDGDLKRKFIITIAYAESYLW